MYNGGHYLRLAIDSALNQDYGNIEVLVIDDGSTDGGVTAEIARSFGDRITFIQQENRGVGGAMNTAVRNMTGHYFSWLSHDDIHLPHKARSQIDFIKRLGKLEACVCSDYELIDENGDSISFVRHPVGPIRNNPRLALLHGLINGCTLLMPRHVLQEFGLFDEKLRYTQDYDLWGRVLTRYEFFHQPDV